MTPKHQRLVKEYQADLRVCEKYPNSRNRKAVGRRLLRIIDEALKIEVPTIMEEER